MSKRDDEKYLEGVLAGLRLCKEMWAQGTISHETIRENEIYYQGELDYVRQENIENSSDAAGKRE